jgi:CHAT domain-containing protein
VYAKVHRFKEAASLFVESKRLAAKSGVASLKSIVGINEAVEVLEEGEYAKAERLFAEQLAQLSNGQFPLSSNIRSDTLYSAALNERKQEKFDKAYEYAQQSVDIFERNIERNAAHGRNYGQSSAHTLRGLMVEDARIAGLLSAKQPSRASEIAVGTFRIPQLATASEAGEALDRMAARIVSGNRAIATAVRERQDLADRDAQLDAQLLASLALPPAQRNASEEAAVRTELQDTASRLEAADMKLSTVFPAYAELTSRKPAKVGDVQRLLGADEAMLVYLVDEDESWLWVVRQDRIQLLHLIIGADALTHEVAALRQRLDPAQNPLEQAFLATRAFALYEKILSPARELLAGTHQLLIVPDGALQSLPFEVLVTRQPARDPDDAQPEEHRNIAWLAREHAVTVLPSVSAFVALRRLASRSDAPAPFAGVGDPVLTGPPRAGRGGFAMETLLRGPLADVESVRQLPPLPDSGEELRTIEHLLGASDSDLYLRERASEPVLRQASLDRYRVVEFATHGLLAGELRVPEPSLVLTPPERATPENDGLLTASKIATLSFNADWIVLSACNTAAGDGRPDAGGLSGLAKAFFYAGARALLVSHWEVKSDAAVRLTTTTFAQLQRDPQVGRAEAFRRAEMAVLDDNKLPPAYAHPMYWAPFVLVGENRNSMAR